MRWLRVGIHVSGDSVHSVLAGKLLDLADLIVLDSRAASAFNKDLLRARVTKYLLMTFSSIKEVDASRMLSMLDWFDGIIVRLPLAVNEPYVRLLNTLEALDVYVMLSADALNQHPEVVLLLKKYVIDVNDDLNDYVIKIMEHRGRDFITYIRDAIRCKTVSRVLQMSSTVVTCNIDLFLKMHLLRYVDDADLCDVVNNTYSKVVTIM